MEGVPSAVNWIAPEISPSLRLEGPASLAQVTVGLGNPRATACFSISPACSM